LYTEVRFLDTAFDVDVATEESFGRITDGFLVFTFDGFLVDEVRLFIFFSFRADLISLQPMLNSNVDIEY
jgi:hypothetical protein